MHKWIALFAAPLVAAVALVASPHQAEACEPASPWEAENISGDQPSCMKINDGDRSTQVLEVDNQCSETVTLGVLECDGTNCEGEPIEVPPGEDDFVFDRDMDLESDNLDDGETFSATFAWTRGDSDEGVVEADVTYQDRSGACSFGGCGCTSSTGGQRPPLEGGMALLLAGMFLLARRADSF